jgi:hypothetical protein
MKRSIAILAAVLAICLPARVCSYAEEAHSFSGDSGFQTNFFLIGGDYALYTRARLHSPHSPYKKECFFSGNFARLTPTNDNLHFGGPVPIGEIVPFKLNMESITLPAGLYHLYVTPTSDCDWVFVISSNKSNDAGVTPVQMLTLTGGSNRVAAEASLHDAVQFGADIRSDHNTRQNAGGQMQIVHDGQVTNTFPLKCAASPPQHGDICWSVVQFNSSDAKIIGKNSVLFQIKIGDREFTSTGEFTLNP